MRNLEEIGRLFEKYLMRKDLHAAEKFTKDEFDVYIGEGGPYYDKNPDFKDGWYESVYMLVTRDPSSGRQMVMFAPLSFAINHDPDLDPQTRRIARINAAKDFALRHIDELKRSPRWRSVNSISATLH